MDKNLLRLHEAIAIVLLNKPNKSADFEQIAFEIDKRKLYPNRKGNISLSKQIQLRSAISSSKYLDTWFKKISETEIKLI